MSKINRYTDITTARYSPMSLQELMLAPQYKRSQHDKLLEASAGLETNIANIDPLDIHSDVAKQEQERLYNSINEQTDLLNKEGFNPNSRQNFLKLNKEYQQAISPTGTIGKINSAKATLKANKDKYLEGAIKDGYSPEAALANWNDFQRQYESKFTESGKIDSIGEMYAPKYYDYIEEGQKLFKDAGITSTDLASGGGKIIMDEKGSYVVNTQNRDVSENNLGQLRAAVDFLNTRMLNPNSDAYKSILHQRKNPTDAISELTGLADVYAKSKTGQQRQWSIGSFKPPEIKDDQNRPTTYINDVIKGYDINNIAEDSPLKMVDRFKDASYDREGNLIAGNSKYKTYEEKVNALKDNYSGVELDSSTGLYKGTLKAVGNAGVGSYNTPGIIPKDPLHYKNELNQLRVDNPSLANLSDKELINRLAAYNEGIESNYVTSIEIPNANYEWMNDRLFGNTNGSGEKGSGIIDTKGATINGKTYTAKEVVDQLGFDNAAEFKSLGEPTVRGYSTSFGKWRVAAKNKDGNNVDLFVDDITEFKDKTSLTREMANLSFQGKSFAKIKDTPDGDALYFINDFVNPAKVVKFRKGVTMASMIPNNVLQEGMDFQTVNAKETGRLVNDPLFKTLSNAE